MNPPGFVRVDMEGSPYTQRTLDFVHELHRMPGQRKQRRHRDPGISEALRERRRKAAGGEAFASACAKARTKSRAEHRLPEEGRRRCELRQADEDSAEERRLSWHGHARREHHPRSAGLRHAARRLRAIRSSSRCCTASAATCSRAWCATAGACASTFRSAPSGIRTSCAAWASARRMCSSLRGTCCGSVAERAIPWHIRANFRLDDRC